MALDERSRRALEELGRQLPKPLPVPETAVAPPEGQPQGRHRVETETDPEVLFRELMQASPDGSVPPHLLDRLRQLELQKRRHQDTRVAETRIAKTIAEQPPQQRRNRPKTSAAASDDPLYIAFEQMLLEDDGD